MARSPSRVLVFVGAIVIIHLCANTGGARLQRIWSIESIAREAGAVVVGEVAQVSTVGSLPEGNANWRHPMLQKQAKVRVLRSFSKPGMPLLAEGRVLSVPYLAIDPKADARCVEGPEFPQLAVGDVRAFPLRRAGSGPTKQWQLLDGQDDGLLMPCVRTALPGAPRRTAFEFLQAEVAGTLAKGSYAEVFRLAERLGSYLFFREKDPAEGVDSLLARSIGKDDERWLRIAVALYARDGTPAARGGTLAPTIPELLAPPSGLLPNYQFAAKALRHVGRTKLDARVLRLAMNQAALHPESTAFILLLNYSPTARELLEDALQRDRPEAVRVAALVIRVGFKPLFLGDWGRKVSAERMALLGRTKELIPATVAAATRLLSRGGLVDDRYLYDAGRVVRSHGDSRAFSLLLDQIRRAQATDPRRYALLWPSAFDWSKTDKPQRSIAVCAILLADRNPVTKALIFRGNEIHLENQNAGSKNVRFCDEAVYAMQKLAGVDFGFRSAGSLAYHDKAVTRAELWLSEHPPRPE
jgi:hypothetical protein